RRCALPTQEADYRRRSASHRDLPADAVYPCTEWPEMTIPFTKAHGAGNDFLLTWRDQVTLSETPIAVAAVAICDRHAGVGADGWLLVSKGSGDPHGAIELWNSDGSRSELSGNGTRCAAALLVSEGLAGEEIRIVTGAGVKSLRLLERAGDRFMFEMNM